jgi:hypothetical protein
LARLQKVPVLMALGAALTLAGCQSNTVGAHAPTVAPAPLANIPLSTPKAELGLIGRDATAVRVQYGKPAFVRKETDSELWRYDGEHCAAFFFLYRGEGGLMVRHVETLPQGKISVIDEACLAGIKARAGASS